MTVGQDTITIGTIAGAIGSIVMDLSGWAWRFLGLSRLTVMEAGGLLLLSRQQLATPEGWIVSLVISILVGALGGMAFAYIIRFTGRDYHFLKALGWSGFMYLLGIGVVLPLVSPISVRTDAMTTLTQLIEHGIYGLVVSYIIAGYADFRTSV